MVANVAEESWDDTQHQISTEGTRHKGQSFTARKLYGRLLAWEAVIRSGREAEKSGVCTGEFITKQVTFFRQADPHSPRMHSWIYPFPSFSEKAEKSHLSIDIQLPWVPICPWNFYQLRLLGCTCVDSAHVWITACCSLLSIEYRVAFPTSGLKGIVMKNWWWIMHLGATASWELHLNLAGAFEYTVVLGGYSSGLGLPHCERLEPVYPERKESPESGPFYK